MFKLLQITLISHASKVMLKILQARLQQYVMFKMVCRKGRGTRNQIVNICWINEKAKEFQKNIYFCFIDYAEVFDCVQFSSVQSLSRVRLFATPWIAACQASLSITSSQTHVHRVSDAIQPSHPLSSPSPPAPTPSQHQSLFQWINSSHEVAKVLEFQL